MFALANGAIEVHGTGHLEDVNGNGFSDMMLHFSVQAIGIHGIWSDQGEFSPVRP